MQFCFLILLDTERHACGIYAFACCSILYYILILQGFCYIICHIVTVSLVFAYLRCSVA